jgi:hypothetical protein
MSWIDIIANIPTNAVLRKQIEELTNEFETMEARIAELEQENTELKAIAQTDNSDLHEIEIAILEMLGQAGDYVPKDYFAGQLQIPAAKAEHYLNSLDDKDYLLTSLNMMTGASYKLSQKGTSYLIESGKL